MPELIAGPGGHIDVQPRGAQPVRELNIDPSVNLTPIDGDMPP